MVVLALDTSSAAGSAALVRDGTLVSQRAGDASRNHGQRLPSELIAVLQDAGAALPDVERLAVVSGPGSFTGLRVGIATIQGIALARDLLVTPVSTFEALAWHARGGTGAIATWVDAHRGEVFATLFESDGRTVLAPASSLAPAVTIDAWHDALAPHGHVRFIGDGAVRYREIIAERLGPRATVDQDVPLLAGAAGMIADAEPARGARPHAISPVYVRRSDVELARDRRHALTKP